MMIIASRTVRAFFGTIALAASTSIASAQLPARLTDREFWQLIENVSEPGGYFLSDNFVSNEVRLQHVIPRLVQVVAPGSVYLGVGPEQNFAYITNLQPGLAFVLDIRRQNMVLHLMYKVAMERSPTRADFLALLLSRPKPSGVDTTSSVQQLFAAMRRVSPTEAIHRANRAAIWQALTVTHGFALTLDDERMFDYVYGAFHAAGPDLTYNYRPGRGPIGGFSTLESVMFADNGEGVNVGYLATEANYRRLRDMHTKNLIVPVVGDFAGPKALRAIGDYLRAKKAEVSVIYTSNVEEYLFSGRTHARYYENVGTLPLAPNAQFVRSAVDGPLIQSATPGGRVTVLAQLLAPVTDFLAKFKAGEILTYRDVINASR
jgi:hypothetical protein